MSKLVKLNNGTTIPRIGLGVYQAPKDVVSRVVREALDIGYRHFDSAIFYQNEQEVSEAIAQWLKDNNGKREEIFYTSKIASQFHGYELAKKTIEESLQKAKSIGYIDLFLIHDPMSNKTKRLETWKALQEFVDAGKIKSIGVSNYGVPHLQELLEWPGLKYKPVVNQIEVHPWFTREELIKFCKDNDIEVEAFSPLARGDIFDDLDPDVVALAKKHDVSVAQILIRWSISKGLIPLPKTVTSSRLVSNFDVYSFELTDEEIAQLDSKNRNWVTRSHWNPAEFPVDQ